jgi:LmbE family N-acetylglucosaminyl deacetylase
MKLAPLALLLALSSTSLAQTTFTDPANLRGERVRPRDGRELPIDTGTLGLQQLLRKLNTRASILNIVAHPDDEDGGMLTLYARGLGARVADLSLTRGEGGQNAMTGDFEDALGLLRTQELLANDRYTGVDQMFGTEVDFGFSKTKEESFAKWTHDRVLYDAVRAIRLFRPLVITATFIGGVTDGHGQHQVSGQIAQEAFLAAGDPTIFPDMIAEGILPWQPLKVYARVPSQSITAQGLYDYATNQFTSARFTNYVTGEVTTTPPSRDIIVHEGTPDLLLTTAAANPTDLSPTLAEQTTPLTYIQFSRIGLGLQKSQIGPGVRNAPTGTFDVAYHLYGSAGSCLSGCQPRRGSGSSAADDLNFFTGIDTSLLGIASLIEHPSNDLITRLKTLDLSLTAATNSFDIHHPAAIAPALADLLTKLNQTIHFIDETHLAEIDKANLLHELRIKQVQLNDALALSLGLTLDATLHEENQIAGSGAKVWSLTKSSTIDPIPLARAWLTNTTGAASDPAPDNEERNQLTSDHPLGQTLTAKPNFTLEISRPYFFRKDIEDPVYQVTRPELRNSPTTSPALTAWTRVSYRGVQIDLGRIVHARSQPVSFVPAVSLSVSAHAQIFPSSEHAVFFSTFLYPIEKPSVEPKITAPAGWKTHIAISDVASPGETKFQIEAPTSHADPITLKASTKPASGLTYTEGYRPIGYGDLPLTNYYTPATDRIVPVDLKLPRLASPTSPAPATPSPQPSPPST